MGVVALDGKLKHAKPRPGGPAESVTKCRENGLFAHARQMSGAAKRHVNRVTSMMQRPFFVWNAGAALLPAALSAGDERKVELSHDGSHFAATYLQP